MRNFLVVLLLLSMSAFACSCSDDSDSGEIVLPDGDSDADFESQEQAEDGDAEEMPPVRYAIEPASMNGFGHETLNVGDAECEIPKDFDAVSVQGIEAVLVQASEDGCSLSFDVQGGMEGDAPIILMKDGEQVLEIKGFSYQSQYGDGLFERTWVIGDSLGAAMVSSYLSYDSQVKDGMYAFFQRQAGVYCPHPLVRKEGFPGLLELDTIDSKTGEIKVSALMPGDMLDYFMGNSPLSDLRLNLNTQAQNLSVPGMHDVMWPFNEVIYDPNASSIVTKQLSMYERLLRFPGEVPEHPTPIMDQVEAGQPTFVHVSMGVLAYVLIEPVYVYDDDLAADMDTFLQRLKDMESKPVVFLGTMPDTASLPTRKFHYSERYENLRISNHMYEAVARANEGLDDPRFFVVPTGEFFLDLMTPQDEISFADETYKVEIDENGWPRMQVADADGVIEPIGLGRFQGFFSLDHVHLTPTGHAMVANCIIQNVNENLGPDSDNPLYAENIPYVNIAEVLKRDPMRESLLQAEAIELGLPDLKKFVDPLPPVVSQSEKCTIVSGPDAGLGAAACPATLEVSVNGDDCGNDPVAFPVEIALVVKDSNGAALKGASVGIAALPSDNHGLALWFDGGLTGDDGSFTYTVDGVDDEQAGGLLQIQVGALVKTCKLP